MAETQYEDLSRIDRMTVTAVEESSSEGVPLSIIAGGLVGIGAGAGVVAAEHFAGLDNTHATIPPPRNPTFTELEQKISGVELVSGLLTAVFTVAAIHTVVKRKYKRIISS